MKLRKRPPVKNICIVLGVINLPFLFTLAVKNSEQKHIRRFVCIAILPANETQGRSVASGKTAGKVFKNGRESPWDVTLKVPITQNFFIFLPETIAY